MFVGKARSLPLSEAPVMLALALLKHYKAGTNTPAYYEHLKVGAKISLITLRPGANVIKRFCPQFINFCNKLEFVPGKPSLIFVSKAKSLT